MKAKKIQKNIQKNIQKYIEKHGGYPKNPIAEKDPFIENIDEFIDDEEQKDNLIKIYNKIKDYIEIIKQNLRSADPENAKLYSNFLTNFEVQKNDLISKREGQMLEKEMLEKEILEKEMKLLERIKNIQKIMHPLEIITQHLQQIKEKSDELSNHGYSKAAQAALELYSNLTVQKKSLIQGKLSVQDFGKDCNKLIEEAQNSELKNHRGFFGSIWHGIKVALNAITFGAVAITPTESIQKTMELKNSLKDFVDSNESEVEDKSQPEENTDLRFQNK